ncbi:MAG: AmmeMemoRadiSam system protein B [Elusimicrobia bacterium]|nr:AmmeMemoRadiSam system protein B [Elusimicrobiota bacterium]
MSEQEPANPLPPLKAGVEAIQFEHEGKPMVLLRDQEGLADDAIGVTLPGFLIAMMLSGKNTVSDVQTAFAKTTGALVSPEEIQGLVKELNRAELLETPEVAAKRLKIHDDFMKNPVRRAMHEGGGYPASPMDLAVYLGGFFRDSKGPGKEVPSQPLGASPQALVAPHIDLARGGPAYAWAYQALGELSPPDLIVAFGVAHASPPSPWVATKKSYATPYGPLAVDEGLYKDFQSALWYEAASDEWVHRTEHSLEFQSLWLKYLWREKTPAWLPVLCSSFEQWCPDRAPSTVKTVDEALKRFGAILRERQKAGQRILILAGVDLAHVGPRFGDEIELTPEVGKKIEDEDRKSLEKALAGDADGFYLSVIQDDHWRKVCGLSALYTTLRLLKEISPTASGKLLTYGQAPDPMGGIVSFTSAIYPRVL